MSERYFPLTREVPEVTPPEPVDAFAAWRRWFKESGNAEFWQRVECVECELGRDCALHSVPKVGAP